MKQNDVNVLNLFTISTFFLNSAGGNSSGNTSDESLKILGIKYRWLDKKFIAIDKRVLIQKFINIFLCISPTPARYVHSIRKWQMGTVL